MKKSKIILKKVKKNDEILTVDDFMDVGTAYMNKKELAGQIARHMIEGQPIDFDNVKLIAEFNIHINNNIPKINLMESADLSKIYRW